MFDGFDLAIIENGQYNQGWPYIHMMPEETAQAAEELHAKALLPAHAGSPWQIILGMIHLNGLRVLVRIKNIGFLHS